MRRIRFLAPAVAAGLMASLAVTAPADAHVADAYYGNRGHGWTNTAHTRVGVEDQRDDGIQILVLAAAVNGAGDQILITKQDGNNHQPGHGVAQAPAGYRFITIMVCGRWNGSTELRSCGESVPA